MTPPTGIDPTSGFWPLTTLQTYEDRRALYARLAAEIWRHTIVLRAIENGAAVDFAERVPDHVHPPSREAEIKRIQHALTVMHERTVTAQILTVPPQLAQFAEKNS